MAAESAAAKVRRVLAAALAGRLDALLDVADLGEGTPPGPPPEVDVLLLVAEAARDRRPVDLVHTSRDGRTTERTVRPYGIVAHAGRWYLAAEDVGSDAVRTFRLDRVVSARTGPGTFEVPPGLDPRTQVLDALARTPWRHAVSVLVHDEAERVRAMLPPGLATVTAVADREGWVRVALRAERLDWVPALLAALDADLVVEGPDELRDRVRVLGRRLLDAAGAVS